MDAVLQVVPSRQWGSIDDFLSDNSGAKPPFFEDSTINIVECDVNTDPTCSERCYTGAASAALPPLFLIISLLVYSVWALDQ